MKHRSNRKVYRLRVTRKAKPISCNTISEKPIEEPVKVPLAVTLHAKLLDKLTRSWARIKNWLEEHPMLCRIGMYILINLLNKCIDHF